MILVENAGDILGVVALRVLSAFKSKGKSSDGLFILGPKYKRSLFRLV